MKTKIDWKNPQEGWKLDETHNIITGCLHNCTYCYARKIATRFPDNYGGPGFQPTFHVERLNYFSTRKKPTTFFLGSMSDMWGDFIPDEWINRVLLDCMRNPKHRYMFLTKCPSRYHYFQDDFSQIPNLWLGTTMESGAVVARAAQLKYMKDRGFKTFVSAEPLLSDFSYCDLFTICDLVIVGAMSGQKAIPPKIEWIESIKHTNVYLKNSIKKPAK